MAQHRAFHLREQIEKTKQELESLQNQLKQAESDHEHKWGDTIPDHIHHEGYTIPADGAGSDWRPSCHVPASTEKRWKRVCQICGHTEYTTRTQQQVTETPRF